MTVVNLDRDVLIDTHREEGVLPNGAAYSHECHDLRTCRLAEEKRQAMEREGAR